MIVSRNVGVLAVQLGFGLEMTEELRRRMRMLFGSVEGERVYLRSAYCDSATGVGVDAYLCRCKASAFSTVRRDSPAVL